MSDAASSVRDFYDFFRREFAFLETDASDSSGHGLMSSYFEATFSPGYPWMHQCGFANVFLKFTLDWDPRDQLFMFNVTKNRDRDIVGEDMCIMETFRFDEILRSFDPGWRSPHGEVDIWDGAEYVRLQIRPSVGFEAFAWRKAVEPVTGRAPSR